MQKLFVYVLILISSYTCLGQKVNKIITVKSNEIKSLCIFPFVSSIKVIKTKNEEISKAEQIKIESEINEDSNENIDELIKIIELPAKNVELDSMSRITYFSEIEKYCFQVWYVHPELGIGRSKMNKIIENIKVSDEMANLIKSQNQRYALCLVNQGVTRTNKSNSNRVFKNIALITAGIAFVGLTGVFWGESKFGVSTYAFIIDSETKKVSNFYLNSSATDPTNKEDMRKRQIFPLFEDYWVWYYQEADKFKKLERK